MKKVKKMKKTNKIIIVDFINFIGIQQGVNYAMYTSDLVGEEK